LIVSSIPSGPWALSGGASWLNEFGVDQFADGAEVSLLEQLLENPASDALVLLG
jgi:hypothetical protein